MGNRAEIAVKSQSESPLCVIYLHWNGGKESTYAFFNATFDFMKEEGRSGDLSYFTARLIQCIGNFMGGSTSLGILKKVTPQDTYDNPPVKFDVSQRACEYFESKANQEKYTAIYDACMAYFETTKDYYSATVESLNNRKKYYQEKIDRIESELLEKQSKVV